jgi:hypothetical protein
VGFGGSGLGRVLGAVVGEVVGGAMIRAVQLGLDGVVRAGDGGFGQLGGHVLVGLVGSVLGVEDDFLDGFQFVAGHLGEVLRRLEAFCDRVG